MSFLFGLIVLQVYPWELKVAVKDAGVMKSVRVAISQADTVSKCYSLRSITPLHAEHALNILYV